MTATASYLQMKRKPLTANEVAVILEVLERSAASGQIDGSWLKSIRSKLEG